MSELSETLELELAKLEALGSPDAIALHLQGYEIKAQCGNSQRCAVALYLAESESLAALLEQEEATLSVGINCVGAYRGAGTACVVNVSEPVSSFISKFDGEQYPELME